MTMGDRIKRVTVVDNANEAAATKNADRSLEADGRAEQAATMTMKQAAEKAKDGS